MSGQKVRRRSDDSSGQDASIIGTHGLTKDKIHYMENIEDTNTTTTKLDDTMDKHFAFLIGICQRILLQNKTIQSRTNDVLIQNKKFTEQHKKITERINQNC
jgi:hypothetical protein